MIFISKSTLGLWISPSVSVTPVLLPPFPPFSFLPAYRANGYNMPAIHLLPTILLPLLCNGTPRFVRCLTSLPCRHNQHTHNSSPLNIWVVTRRAIRWTPPYLRAIWSDTCTHGKWNLLLMIMWFVWCFNRKGSHGQLEQETTAFTLQDSAPMSLSRFGYVFLLYCIRTGSHEKQTCEKNNRLHTWLHHYLYCGTSQHPTRIRIFVMVYHSFLAVQRHFRAIVIDSRQWRYDVIVDVWRNRNLESKTRNNAEHSTKTPFACCKHTRLIQARFGAVPGAPKDSMSRGKEVAPPPCLSYSLVLMNITWLMW